MWRGGGGGVAYGACGGVGVMGRGGGWVGWCVGGGVWICMARELGGAGGFLDAYVFLLVGFWGDKWRDSTVSRRSLICRLPEHVRNWLCLSLCWLVCSFLFVVVEQLESPRTRFLKTSGRRCVASVSCSNTPGTKPAPTISINSLSTVAPPGTLSCLSRTAAFSVCKYAPDAFRTP